MTVELDDIHRLREAFRNDTGPALDDGAHCPPADALIDAEAGDLEGPAWAEVVDHVGQCPACTDAWRLATAARRAEQPEAAAPIPMRPSSSRRRAPWLQPLLAAAACATIVLGIRLMDEDGATRSADDAQLVIEVESPPEIVDGRTLPFSVRWRWRDEVQQRPENVTYRVLVRDARGVERHRSIALAVGDRGVDYVVPALRWNGVGAVDPESPEAAASLAIEVCVEVAKLRTRLIEQCTPVQSDPR